MNDGVKFTGIPSGEELKASPGVPGPERMEKGPVAFIECVQNIPCNPCEDACPFGAITVGRPITNLPVIDEEKCTGCGLCIAACPGLAIFRIHKNYTRDTALVDFPHEYHPLPAAGTVVPVADRTGQKLGQGKIIKVKKPAAYNQTAVITVEVPQALCHEVRAIYREEQS
ncbi:MAG: 4Fe-4S binding protein [Clostridia bacterium]|jgi:Fe-S-cluster-containing hydrogenase component 2|nr:4Fe-4S binding protein [Clostridia bacterium]